MLDIKKIQWFNNRQKFDIDFFDLLEAQRKVSEHPRYKSGTIYSEKCKRYIQYESGLELSFINRLEESKKVLFYWDQPVQIPYWRGKVKQLYTPDFGIYLKSHEFILAEVKDLPGMLDNRVQMKLEGLIKYCSKRGFGLLLTDGRDSLDKFRKIKSNRKLENAVVDYLRENRVLRKRQSQEFLKMYDATQYQLLKCVYRNNLKFRSRNWNIQPDNKNNVFRHVFIDKLPYENLLAGRYATLAKYLSNPPTDIP